MLTYIKKYSIGEQKCERNDYMLTQRRLKEVLDYNPDTGEFRWKIKLNRRIKIGDMAGTKTSTNPYILIKIDNILYRAHRLAWLYVYGYFPENDIDHINRNKLDNRISNLREVSRQCNTRNCKLYKNNTSGVKGVHWDKIHNCWKVQIGINKTQKYLGLFDNLDNAVMARYQKERELNWRGCDSTSPARKYLVNKGLI